MGPRVTRCAGIGQARQCRRRQGRSLRGWRGRLVAGLVAVVVAALAAPQFVPPDVSYRAVAVDGGHGGCYRVYHSPVDLGRLLRDQRRQEPFVVVYQPPAQPIFASSDLTGARDVVTFRADESIFDAFALPAHAERSFYRQPITPIATVVVYYPADEPPEGLPTKTFHVGGPCPVIMPPTAVSR